MTNIKLLHICEHFFKELEKADLLDHPEVFSTLDSYARHKDFMICAEQRGIFGTRLFFENMSKPVIWRDRQQQEETFVTKINPKVRMRP